jgi:hypothetical protein
MSRTVIYRLEVRATQPIREDGDECEDYPTLEWATSSKARIEIEKALFACLRRMEQDCDCECMDFSIEEDV